jgi:hypothetical protein
MVPRCAMVPVVLLLGTVGAAAQTPARSFAELKSTLTIGETVVITDDKKIVTTGKVDPDSRPVDSVSR